MDEKLKKYILMVLWVAVGVAVIWFFASGLNIYALFYRLYTNGVVRCLVGDLPFG